MSFVYVDVERAEALSAALRTAGPGAGDLVRDINAAVSLAESRGAHYFGSGLLGSIMAASVPYTVGPQQTSEHGTDTADEIERRLAYLAVIDDLISQGYDIPRALWFDDEDPPSAADIEELAQAYRDWEEGDSTAFALDDSFTAAEINAALALLTPAEMSRLDEALSEASSSERLAIANQIWSGAGPEQMERVHQHISTLEPTLAHADRSWSQTTADVSGPFSYDDVFQGSLGNCWFLAGLSATAVNNPEFLQNNIVQNPNGSYTVTLYPDGDPVQVTVSNYVPDPPYARGANNQANWVTLYEKAAAQLIGEGDYSDIEGGFGGAGLGVVTGQPTNLDVMIPSLDTIEERLDNGQPVVVSTDFAADWWLVGRDDLVPMHVYVVVDVVTIDGERKVHLRNPWGNDGGKDGAKVADLYLSQSELRSYFISLNDAEAP